MGVEIARVRYRLVGAVFEIEGPQRTELGSAALPQGGALTVALPEGTYTVTLRPGWDLERATPQGGWEPVAAQLIGDATQTIQIERLQTTVVRYRFSTAHGVVDTAPGTLSIEIDVVERVAEMSVERVATNDAQICVIDDQGEVRCQDQRVEVSGRATAIALGDAHTCVLLEGGRVRCWGNGGDGRLGYGNTASIMDDAALEAAGDVDVGGVVTQIAAGSQHTCALLESGAVRCWGLGITGALGYGNRSSIGDDELPRSAGDVPLGEPATQLAAGGVNTCAVLGSGALRCWGFSDFLGMSYGDDEPASAAPPRTFEAKVKQLAMGVGHHCSLLENDTVACEAFSSTRYLPGTDHLSDGPVGQQPGQIAEIAAGYLHNCALFTSGQVRCWGSNLQGQLGVPTRRVPNSVPASQAVTVPGFSRAVHLGLGKNRSCAVLADGSLVCWPRSP